jgi:pyridoxamine 5'-phosphate oxidase
MRISYERGSLDERDASADPLVQFDAWFTAAEAAGVLELSAMTLATVGADDRPSTRIVLLKGYDAAGVVFFTNYHSRKGRELTAHPQGAAVLHWDTLHRQVRIEGPLLQSPAEESDRYFALRPLDSRLGAWASQQSEPLASRAALQDQVRAVKERFAIGTALETPVTRPPHWGGFRLWIERLELWVEGPGRIHDRAVWERTLQPAGLCEFSGTGWSATRLNP